MLVADKFCNGEDGSSEDWKDAHNQLSKALDPSKEDEDIACEDNSHKDCMFDKLDEVKNVIKELRKQVATVSADELNKIEAANKRRQGIRVQYYQVKELPDIQVEVPQRLRELMSTNGFGYVDILECETNCIQPPNTISFGSEIDNEDIKLVAQRFMRGEERIEMIRPFVKERQRFNYIQITYEPDSDHCDGFWQDEDIFGSSINIRDQAKIKKGCAPWPTQN